MRECRLEAVVIGGDDDEDTMVEESKMMAKVRNKS